MKDIWERWKKQVLALFMAALFGYCVGKVYTWNDIITDCKVLGMTRYGQLPIGCRVGEKSQ